MMWTLLAYVTVFLYAYVPANADSVIVNIQYGQVEGKRMAVRNTREIKNVDVFRAIPYAKEPTGDRRFRSPEEPDPWGGVFDATTPGDACPQFPIGTLTPSHPGWRQFSENCLHLDIVSPDVSKGPYPVMFWVHGGGYFQGANIQYPGHFLAMRDVVVVIINYRLGKLGFAFTNNDACPGNAGMLDQTMALEFVVNNIASFGGDPNQITVFGESAGGSSTGLLIVSPLTKGLFQRAILESGAESGAYADPASQPERYTYEMADNLGCGSEPDDYAMMDCLRTKNWTELIYDSPTTCPEIYPCKSWAPVVDNPNGFLPKTPADLRDDGDIMKGPIITGINKDDGSLFAIITIPFPTFGCCNRTTFQRTLRERYMKPWSNGFDETTEENFYQALDWRYTPWPYLHDNDKNRDALVRLSTDMDFGIEWDRQMKVHQEVAPTYGYLFNYKSLTNHRYPDWMGVTHAVEVSYVWGHTLLQYNPEVLNDSMISRNYDYDENDVKYSLFIQDLFTNFAKTGNPTPEPVQNPLGGSTVWPEFKNDAMDILHLGNETSEPIRDYQQDIYAFWDEYKDYLVYGIPSNPEAPYSVIVQTQYGDIRGKRMAVNNTKAVKNVDVFRGIPYAKSPTRSRRFMKPDEIDPWVGIRNADIPGNACPQIMSGVMSATHPDWERFSEDCLHLDIFSPDVTNGPYPVMVWIHGGGYIYGANFQYPGHFLAMHDVVVVSINYRLGNLGFSYTANDACPGNAGLWDQKMALEFVVNNIAKFGGDPNQITVFGESAGAGSTGLLMVSPQTKGLFHQAILESGAETNIWTINDPDSNPENYTYQMAEQVGCGSEPNDDAMMDCLRDKDWEELVFDVDITCTPGYYCGGQVPVVDNAGFLPKTPAELRKDGDIMKGPIITGINKDDGSIFVPAFVPGTLVGCCNRTHFQTVMKRFISIWLVNYDEATQEDIIRAFDWRYSPWPHEQENEYNREALTKISTDIFFGTAWDTQLKDHQEVAPTYGYVFNYRGEKSPWPEWMGVPHADEVGYIHGWPMLIHNPDVYEDSMFSSNLTDIYTDEDIKYSLFIQEMITNFAKTGNPTPVPVVNPLGGTTTWPRFYMNEMGVLHLNNDAIETLFDYKQHYYAFWKEYMEFLQHRTPPIANDDTDKQL